MSESEGEVQGEYFVGIRTVKNGYFYDLDLSMDDLDISEDNMTNEPDHFNMREELVALF